MLIYCDVPAERPDDKTSITGQRLAIPRQQCLGNRCPGDESRTMGFPHDNIMEDIHSING
jgi:hypothetical protein